MTDRNGIRPDEFECVEPDLGAQLWRRDDPALDPVLKERLADHLLICDACRLELLIKGRIEGGLRAGELHLDGVAGRRRPPQGRPGGRRGGRGAAALGGGLALAASLALMLVLPPAGRTLPGVVRGGPSGTGFQRPVEGEVLLSDRPTLRWSPITGATAYRVDVSRVDGTWSWSGRTEQTSLTLPAASPLPDEGEYRALIEPVPADLAGLVDVSVYFRRSGPGGFLLYRAGAAPWWVRALGGLGLVVLFWSMLTSSKLFRRKPAADSSAS